MPETLTVNLGERSYPILLGADLSAEVRARAEDLRAAGRKLAVVTDAHLAEAQGAALQAMFGPAPRHAAPAGEAAKSLSEFGRVLDFLAAQRLGRSDALFAVGGGVVGDLAGFAAASYLRGIDYFQVPTTLLAMVDSSVGGKTGLNLGAGKNLVGAFHQPRGVFISVHLLRTLPAREFAAGSAEVIKCGLIGDEALFRHLEDRPLGPSGPELAGVIRRCCALKARVVEADERELAGEGGRALLNLGHTFGHAIEQATGYGVYLHGEAVAIGLCAAARLSVALGRLPAADAGRIERVLAAHALPTRLRSPLPLAALAAAAGHDKKVRGGSPRYVVLDGIGAAATAEGVDPGPVEAAWRAVGAA